LSRAQFQIDIEVRGYRDARIPSLLTAAEVERWTRAAEEEKKS
jgi:hypothetical protein